MPRAHRSRAAALVLLLNLAGVPARAFSRSGSMSWNFNDITTKNPSGNAHYSSWGQAYGLNLGGDLVHPVVGTFNTGGSYSEGANINSTVNSGATGQRNIGGNAASRPLSIATSSVISASPPTIRVQSTKYAGNPDHTITNNLWGYTTGLSLPHMPAISASRQYNRIKNAYGGVSIEQNQTLMRESLSYQLAGLRLSLNQERQRTEDARAGFQSPLATTQRGSSTTV